tara:strand:- start:173 stop:1219 length:1047 start_codon:yes stop_codon:yes gene_type:complete
MSRLIFFAQPHNIEWAVTKLNSTLHLFQHQDGLPLIERVLLLYDNSFSQDMIDEHVNAIKNKNYKIELDELVIPSLGEVSNWNGDYGLRDKDWILLPHPGILLGKILHEVTNSFDFREGNIGLCHPNPDGKTITMFALHKTTFGPAGLPKIRMKKVPLKTDKYQTLKMILDEPSNGNFNTVLPVATIPQVHKRAIDIEVKGTHEESTKYIIEHINPTFGFGFESIVQSILSTNRDLIEIYHSVYFGTHNRESQEEDFFVLTKSQQIIWISCKFTKNIGTIEKEVKRLRLIPPLNFPKERIYSILATSRHVAEKYYSGTCKDEYPDVHVCHVGNINEKIDWISKQDGGN